MRTHLWKVGLICTSVLLLFWTTGCQTDGVGSENPYEGYDADPTSDDVGGRDTRPDPGADAGADGAVDGLGLPDDAGSDAGTNDGGASDGTADAPTPDAAPTACTSDEDCSGGDVCVVDRSGNRVELVCKSPNSMGGDVGESCSNDSDCAANLCRNGKCTKPCSRPVQCSSDGSWTCKQATVMARGGGSSRVNICQPAPAKMCLSDGDCGGNKKCVARKRQNSIEFVCGNENQGGGTIGDSCSKDSDCAKNLCVDGTCTVNCASDNDCSGAPNHECQTTSVDLGNGNTASASICVNLTPCDEDDQCKVSEVCFVERDTSNSAGFCRPPNPGGDNLGDVCQKDSHCAANLCYDARFRKICSVPCKDASDCTEPGFRCRTRSMPDGQGGTTSKKICVPDAPAQCDKQGDCGSTEHCSIVPKTSGGGLESVCIPDPGGLATGNACGKDSDCKSLVCINGACASPCTSRSQCANNQVCEQTSISKNGQSGSFDVCKTLPDQKCSSTGTCNDPVRVCSDLRRMGGTVEAYCRFPNSGATGQLGDSCTMHGDCKSGLCKGALGGSQSPYLDRCSTACTGNAQCAGSQICANFGGSKVSVCQKPCTTNANCSGNNICQINEDPNTNPNSIDTVCRKPNMGSQFGATCNSGANCRSGLCLTVYTFRPADPRYQPCTRGQNQCASGWGCYPDPSQGGSTYCADLESRCTRLCSTNANCTGGASGNTFNRCDNSINYPLSDGGSTQISACSR